jgi:hypothetical protein
MMLPDEWYEATPATQWLVVMSVCGDLRFLHEVCFSEVSSDRAKNTSKEVKEKMRRLPDGRRSMPYGESLKIAPLLLKSDVQMRLEALMAQRFDERDRFKIASGEQRDASRILTDIHRADSLPACGSSALSKTLYDEAPSRWATPLPIGLAPIHIYAAFDLMLVAGRVVTEIERVVYQHYAVRSVLDSEQSGKSTYFLDKLEDAARASQTPKQWLDSTAYEDQVNSLVKRGAKLKDVRAAIDMLRGRYTDQLVHAHETMLDMDGFSRETWVAAMQNSTKSTQFRDQICQLLYPRTAV